MLIAGRRRFYFGKTTYKKTEIGLFAGLHVFWRVVSGAFGAPRRGARKVIRQTVAAAAAVEPINSRCVERSFIGTRLCSCLFYWCAAV